MTISFTCHDCGHESRAELSQAGRKIACGGCGKALTVPAPMEPLAADAKPATVLRFACPSCRRKFATRPDLAGKKIRCNGCGAGVVVPGVAAVTGSGHSSAELDASPGPDDSALPVDLAAIAGVKRPRRAETVLPSRSEVMEQVRQKVAEKEAVAAEKKAEKAKKKKKKKHSGYFDPKDTLVLVGGVAAFVGVLAFFAWGYPDFRFPLGGLLCLIGFIVYLLGAASLRQLVAEEGAIKALLFRFFPPYQWWFVATRWSETKDFFAFFAAGLVILSIGGWVIKSSPIGKEAEASEREYQKLRRGGQAEVPPAVPKVAAEVGK